MILAHTLPAAIAPQTRQGSDASATNAQSDGTDTPFGGVLDKVADGSGRRTPAQPLRDGASEGQGRPTSPGRVGSDLAGGVASVASLPSQADAYALPAAASASPITSASDAAGSAAFPADLASFLAALTPAASDSPAKPAADVGTPTTRAKSGGKSAPDAGEAASASSSGNDVTSLSNLLGLAPAGSAQSQTVPLNAGSGKDLTSVGTGAAGTGVRGAALPDQAAGGPVAAGDGTAASQGTAASHAHATQDKGDGFAASLAPILKSVSVETQLAPAIPLSPTLQVVATVQKLAAASAGAAAQPDTTQAASSPSSKAITLVLEPQDLGTVTVRLQLRGGSLDLQLDVDNTQTLGLLARDKDNLTAAIAGQDYQVGTLTLRASDAQNSSQGSDHGSRPHDQSAGSQSGSSDTPQQGQSSQGGSGPAGGSRQDARAGRSRAPDQGSPARAAGAADAAVSGGVYI